MVDDKGQCLGAHSAYRSLILETLRNSSNNREKYPVHRVEREGGDFQILRHCAREHNTFPNLDPSDLDFVFCQILIQNHYEMMTMLWTHGS